MIQIACVHFMSLNKFDGGISMNKIARLYRLCPKCKITKPTNEEEIHRLFGYRVVGGKKIRQSQCRKCRGFDPSFNVF